MRVLLVAVAAVTVAGCGSGVSVSDRDRASAGQTGSSPDAESGASAVDAPVIVPAVWDVAPGDRRGRTVELRWTTSKCQLFHAALVTESATAVTITLQEKQVGDGLCPNYRVASRKITLAAPVGNRALLDGAVTPPRRVA